MLGTMVLDAKRASCPKSATVYDCRDGLVAVESLSIPSPGFRAMLSLSQQILRTDLAGMPLEWIDYKAAARLYFLGQVAYACGHPMLLLRGGVNARTRSPQLSCRSIRSSPPMAPSTGRPR